MKLNKEIRVAISGKSGCGNTTVSGMLAKTLGVTLINYTFRQLAAEKGMTLPEGRRLRGCKHGGHGCRRWQEDKL